MRFFSPSTSRTDRPRSPSSSSSSSASIIVAEDARPFTAPPPTRMNTAQLPSSRLPLSPAASPEKASISPSIEAEEIRPGRYAAFPKNLHAELEEYDARASRAEPIHYFSDNRHAQYVCRECMIPLALQDEVVSKAFSGSLGQAYLMHSTVNTYLGKKEDKRLLTGMHTVADLLCMGCQQLGRKTTLGWMYIKAKERDQQYKEGKYILEAARVIKENNWSLDD